MKYLLLLLTISLSYYSLAQSNKYSPVQPFGYEIIEFKENLRIADITTYKPQIGFENLDSLSKKEFLSEEVSLLFDEKGNLIEHTSSSFNSGFGGLRKTTYKYNDKNNLVESIYERKNDAYKIVYEYFEESENFNQIKYGYDDYKKKYDVKYDSYTVNEIENGLLLSRKESTSYGSIKKEIYKYNSHGDEIYDSRYGVITETKYEYDQRDNIIKECVKNNYNKGGCRYYKYDLNNNMIEQNNYELNKVPIVKVKRKYIDNHLIQETIQPYVAGQFLKPKQIDYKVDYKGNWIEKKVTRDGFPGEIVIRKFTYLDRVHFDKISSKYYPVNLTPDNFNSETLPFIPFDYSELISALQSRAEPSK